MEGIVQQQLRQSGSQLIVIQLSPGTWIQRQPTLILYSIHEQRRRVNYYHNHWGQFGAAYYT